MGNGAMAKGPSHRAHPRLYQLRYLPLLGLPMLERAAYDIFRAHGAALIYQFCCDRLRELWMSGRQTRVNYGRLELRVRTKTLIA